MKKQRKRRKGTSLHNGLIEVMNDNNYRISCDNNIDTFNGNYLDNLVIIKGDTEFGHFIDDPTYLRQQDYKNQFQLAKPFRKP